MQNQFSLTFFFPGGAYCGNITRPTISTTDLLISFAKRRQIKIFGSWQWEKQKMKITLNGQIMRIEESSSSDRDVRCLASISTYFYQI